MKTPKSIQVKVLDHPEELIVKAKEIAERYGVQFFGDSDKGVIKGYGIEADYMFQEDILTVTVFRKPLLLSWAKVEQKVRKIVATNSNQVI
ncbi:hypothetical protein [Methylomarinum vadi]|uniref:hypothetical protein n=1 Tax=Methylomarinum vadi TaxID=438855 RepID=UPI0004DEEB2E|nr:hypothetical protein [Methylomarinum vadi]